MPLQSMTGFARSEGAVGRYRWSWELRSVNGKGLDIRFRLPNGMERLEGELRRIASERVSRGNIQAALTLTAESAGMQAVLNRDAFDAVLRLRDELGDLVDTAPLQLDTLLSIRGLVDFRESEDSEEAIAELDRAVLDSARVAFERLQAMREREGTSLADLFEAQLTKIATLADMIEADPARSPQEIVRKLSQQLQTLMEAGPSLDSDRLYAEAAMLATKADIREELDRLKSHVVAARELLAEGGPVGRKLDFLAQEFNRESNTICSKSNSAAVTAAGIELKVVIDQFREQIQNLE
ncbi:YicC/YloC family endoribonuclease [Rhizobium sp. NRK18]|uniref:YicC/YloC family endoribonuclease n=1 Tax=Rhizobium sp. NRK18 TaxID=2964667 RepID=UPI0021C344C8|nr:YicC/YloC family endoribonuclease [Rhizobium sp. NRK18]MCQ2004711.1 YicC family protein [Rhizobium sp. NRK18]